MEAETIERGWSVYTEDNKRVGDVVEVHAHYLLVSRGLVVVRDVYVPRYAVASVEGNRVQLAITDERLRHMGWTSPPPPPPPPADSAMPRLVPPVTPDSDFAPFRVDEDTTGVDDAAAAAAPPDASADAFADTFVDDPFAALGAPLDDYEDMGVLFGSSVEVDGEAYLAMQRIGEGPVVVLVHGWGIDRRVWDYLTLDLPRDYTVVTYDARGYGRSSAPWTGYTLAQASRDLRVLLRTLDLQDATLVGLDLGAAAALHYVATGGRRAARLVLIAPIGVPAGAVDTVVTPAPLQEWQNLLRTDRPRLAAELAALWAPDASAETQLWLRDGLLAAAPHALLHGLESLAAPALDTEAPDAERLDAERLGAVTLPVRMLCGRADPLVPFEQAQAVAEAIPGAQVVALDVPGHLPMIAAAGQVVAEIRAAITGTTAATRDDEG